MFSSIVQGLPALVPFMAPEALERLLGRTMYLRLGANESNFGISPHATEAMKKAAEHIGWYGDPECFELRERLAAKHGVSRENVLVSTGLDDVLSICARTFLNPGDCAVNSLGGYPTFNYGVAGVGGLLEFVRYSEDRVDISGLVEAAHRCKAKVVFIANPDNPSGTWHDARMILELANKLPSDCVLLLDEAYYDFAPTDAIPLIDVGRPNIVRLRTFSKAHGLAGARVGYAIASAEIVGAMNKIRMHFGVGISSQAGAVASLGDSGFLASVLEEVARGRQDYMSLASELGLRTLPSATNFVAIDMGSFERAKATLEALLRRGVFIRMPSAPPLNRCVRITVGTPPERACLAEVFTAVVHELP